MSRFRGKIPFDPSITQKVKNALFEAGREDLLDALRDSGMAELEENYDLLKKRVIALEQEKVNWVTESGVYRAIEKKAGKIAVNWGKLAARGLIAAAGAALLAGFAWLVKMAWKGLHA